MRKSTRVTLAVSLAAIFAGPPLSTMAQQPANQQPASGAAASAVAGGTTGTIIGADAEHRATIITYQSDKPESESSPVARYEYYRWNSKCYSRYPSGGHVTVPPGYC